MQIDRIRGREILDSRGNPTVEAEVFLSNGEMARASVPSGASTGSHEACELRDNEPARYQGKGVLNAVNSINNEINAALKGFLVNDQTKIDTALCDLDGTPNKSRLGANALLAVSLASARAHSQFINKPLFVTLNQKESMCMPVPLMNVLNGGSHADNNMDIQEVMLVPIGFSEFPDALQSGVEIFHCLKSLLKQNNLSTAVGDEGGFAPDLKSNRQALDLLSQAVHQAGYDLGSEIVFALDVAASELFHEGLYHLTSEDKQFSSEEMIAYYERLSLDYPIFSIEDGLDENDWLGWKHLTGQLGKKIQLVGDDLFVTNASILERGIREEIANAILIKPNQIGTLSETRQAMKLAFEHGYRCVISHRSGETEDTFIADLAVATGCGQIKIGSLCRTDRIAKYNQLIRIYEESKLPYKRNIFSSLSF